MRIFFFHLICFFFLLKIKYLARLYSKQHFCWKHRSSLSFRINEIKKYKIIIKYNKKIPRRRKKTWQYNVYYSNLIFFYIFNFKNFMFMSKKNKWKYLNWKFLADYCEFWRISEWVLVKSLLISSMGFEKKN